MKLKALVLAVFVAGIGASFALADDGGRGTTTTGTTTTAATATTTTTTTTGEKPGRDCRRAELRGTLVSLSGSSLVVDVTRARKPSASLGTQLTLTLDARTRVTFRGLGRFTPQTGDRVRALVARCASTGTALVARWVDVRGVKAEAAGAKPDNVRAAPQKGDRGQVPERPEKREHRQ
jgi:hypothetical protein